MVLKIYRDVPFNIGTETDLVDLFTGDGSTDTFTLTNKTGNRLAATIQFDGTQYFQFTGGFTKSGDSFTLNTPPPADSQGVAPGLSAVLFETLFDVDEVEGITDPRVREVAFYIADPDQIHLYTYHNFPTKDGIEIVFTDLISSAGALTSWVQLACASPDETGSALTYQATGTPLYTAAFYALGSLIASTAAGASSCFVDAASDFISGDYILINPGEVTQEVVKIHTITSQEMTISGFDFEHADAENVFMVGRKFFAKCTVPLNAANNEATNFYDLGLNINGIRQARG